AYITPTRLYKAKLRPDDCCPKCQLPGANFFHLLWTCPTVALFWVHVTATPRLCLLGIVSHLTKSHSMLILLRETLFLARKCIALKWLAGEPPIIVMWKKEHLTLSQLVYMQRENPGKFELVWQPWLDSPMTT
ncbi:hypothetical protein XELAEV_18029153mg, partial [Xenopus laevis]